MVRQYIGPRYVTKIYENSQDPSSAEWEAGVNYEPLTLVTYNNGSYLSKKDVPGSVGDPASNSDYWVQTGFYNGQIASLQSQIDTINLYLTELTSRSMQGKNALVNLILNDLIDTSVDAYYPQGGCYVDNGFYVQYFSKGGSNTGLLKCYNLNTYTLSWSHTMTLYHGNSITYNPTTNKLYVVGHVTHDGTSINSVFVIDWNDPSTIEETINLVGTTDLMGLAYDRDSGYFYAQPHNGTVILKYNGDLDTLLSTQTLDSTPVTDFNTLGVYGASVIINGVIYNYIYPPFNAIIGWDLSTGKVAQIVNLPRLASKCRSINEIEALAYDYDNGRFFITFGTDTDYINIKDHVYCNIAEVDVLKDIVYRYPIPQKISTAGRNSELIEVENGDTSLKPMTMSYNTILSCMGDVINFIHEHDAPGVEISFRASSPIATVYKVNYSNLVATINGNSTMKITGADIRGSRIAFTSCIFDDTITYSGMGLNLHTAYSSISLINCTFNQNVHMHIFADLGTNLIHTGSTFNGTASMSDVYVSRSLVNGTFTV